MRLAILCSRIRVEEKMLFAELERRGFSFDLIDVRHLVLDTHNPGKWPDYDLVVDRCISQSQAEALLQMIESYGVCCANSYSCRVVCGNKLSTTLRLQQHHVPTPAVKVAVEPESAIEAIEQVGYPSVLKPVFGSWGRLLARINDRDAAEALVEHKSTLGGLQHSIFYVQPYFEKPGYDLRTFVIGNRTVCGIRRRAEHWITNTARGATAEACQIHPQLDELSRQAARAVGGGAVAVDFFESADGQLSVNEVNATMEFRNSVTPTGVNIPGLLVDHFISLVV